MRIQIGQISQSEQLVFGSTVPERAEWNRAAARAEWLESETDAPSATITRAWREVRRTWRAAVRAAKKQRRQQAQQEAKAASDRVRRTKTTCSSITIQAPAARNRRVPRRRSAPRDTSGDSDGDGESPKIAESLKAFAKLAADAEVNPEAQRRFLHVQRFLISENGIDDSDLRACGGKNAAMLTRTLGPYRHPTGNKYRICIKELGKPERWIYFDTTEEAQREANRLRRGARKDATPTMDEVLTEYAKVKKGENRQRSIDTTINRLRFMFERVMDEPIGTLSSATCKNLVVEMETKATRYQRPMGPTTRLAVVAESRTFLAWCVERTWLRASPLDGVKVRGRKARGKPQLTEDEAAKLLKTLLPGALEGEAAALAVLLALLHGPRASEITDRTVRELDGGGRLLRITEAKTAKGVRTIHLAAWLQPLLRKLAEGKPPEAPLFGRGRHWLHYHTVRYCRRADIPRVTPHGLRGTFASLDIMGADILTRTANLLGHESSTTTLRHYAAPEAVNAAHANRVQDSLVSALARISDNGSDNETPNFIVSDSEPANPTTTRTS